MSASTQTYRGLTNDLNTQVVSAIDGTLLSHPHLLKLDGGRDIKVVVSADWNAGATKQVALVSGGGDGHYPAHIGYIGEGMLTAAVSGEVFASPSVSAVLAAIRTVARPSTTAAATTAADTTSTAAASSAGVLLIVKNYTGDRLNFGLALSQAQLLGIHTRMVIVGDDVALPRSRLGAAGRRGVAGTVLVHKIAGYAAASGMSLSAVAAAAEEAASSIVSLGVAWRAATVPGSTSASSQRIHTGKAEMGIGIHNEAGAEGVKEMKSAKETIREMIDTLLSRDEDRDYFYRRDSSATTADAAAAATTATAMAAEPIQLVVLINNMGGATNSEMQLATLEAMSLLQPSAVIAPSSLSASFSPAVATANAAAVLSPYADKFIVRRLLVGTFMTALNMEGVSISLLRLSADAERREWQLRAIDAPTTATAWPKQGAIRDPHMPSPIPLPPPLPPIADDTTHRELADATVRSILATVATAVKRNKDHLNALDAVAGDGDCGSTLTCGAEALESLLQRNGAVAGNLSTLFATLAQAVGEHMGGSSGALVQILLTAAAREAKKHTGAATTAAVAHALETGIAAVSQFGGAKAGDRTFLDAVIPAVQALRSQSLAAAATAARDGAERTKAMRARAGRASYVAQSDETRANADPGAEAVAIIFEALASRA